MYVKAPGVPRLICTTVAQERTTTTYTWVNQMEEECRTPRPCHLSPTAMPTTYPRRAQALVDDLAEDLFADSPLDCFHLTPHFILLPSSSPPHEQHEQHDQHDQPPSFVHTTSTSTRRTRHGVSLVTALT